MAQAPGGEVLVYEAPDGGARVEVKLDRDTVWLTQRQMADLFDTSTDNVGLHLNPLCIWCRPSKRFGRIRGPGFSRIGMLTLGTRISTTPRISLTRWTGR